jgi:sec-independent protein translocase protein TatC
LMFQLPIVVFFLSKAGIVTPQFLRNYRKHAIVVILIISAIITPPDIFSQVLISLPILLLYEISIQVSRFVIKKERKYWEEDEDTPAPLDQIQ